MFGEKKLKTLETQEPVKLTPEEQYQRVLNEVEMLPHDEAHFESKSLNIRVIGHDKEYSEIFVTNKNPDGSNQGKIQFTHRLRNFYSGEQLKHLVAKINDVAARNYEDVRDAGSGLAKLVQELDTSPDGGI